MTKSSDENGESPEALARCLSPRLLEGGRRVSLDAIAEALGPMASSTPHINALMDQLESQGATVEAGELPDLRGLLARVLESARAKRALGAPASVDSIALELGLEARLVRVALLYAEVLMRGRPAPNPGSLH